MTSRKVQMNPSKKARRSHRQKKKKKKQMMRSSSNFKRTSSEYGEVQFTITQDGRIRITAWEDKLPKFLIDALGAMGSGRIEEAKALITDDNIEIIRQMIKKDPSNLVVRYMLAATFVALGKSEEAEQWYEDILRIEPNWAVYNELGNIKEKKQQYAKEMEYRQKALQEDPDNGILLNNYGMLLVRMGRAKEGNEMLRRAVPRTLGNAVVHSNLVFFMHYLHDVDRQSLFEGHKRWAQEQAPVNLARTSHNNDPDPDRRLRIGYVSPDFRSHSVQHFFEVLLDEQNRREIETFGYSNRDCPDEVTERLKSKFDHFQNIWGAGDLNVVDMILKDKIDILVDLAGHTGNNRLPVFGHKPAPIQVTYLGYPNTTGMEQIDYRFTDELADPPESQEFYTEELVYLPDGFLSYRPPDYAPLVGPLSALRNGYITFGSFNNNCKINPLIMTIWAEVLKANRNSRMILKFRGGEDKVLQQHYFHEFEKLGISPDRIEIYGGKPPVEHLLLYNRIDIALDTYPYNGTTTTFEALWMGVPVISLVGQHHMSRMGLSILTRFGMGFLAASSPEDYLIRATTLAAKPDTLAEMRAVMRRTMAGASLCNTSNFVRNLETAYRKMWHRWCQSKGVNASIKKSGIQTQNSDDSVAERCPVLEKNSSAAQNRPPQANSHKVSPISQLAVMADEMHRTGRRSRAVEYAVEGFKRTFHGEESDDVPQHILLKWNARNEKTLFLLMCISLISYSSYFNPEMYRQLFTAWKNLEPSNPEPYLRLGLLLALEAQQAGTTVPSSSLEALRHADKIMRDERSAAALALAQCKLTELALPYDGGRIHVYPNLSNLTTYVLLEKGDWFEHEDLALFRKLISPNDLVLDLGANVGVYAISAALRTSSQGHVLAVEPSRQTFSLLNASAAAFPHMTCVHCGVSNENSTGLLSYGQSPELNTLGNQKQNSEKVDLFALDDLATEMGFDHFNIIKMDVEGYEQRVLAGGKKIIGENSPIIFYEIKEKLNFNFELIDAFSGLGYDSYYYVRGTSTLVKPSEVSEVDCYLLNMVAARPESLGRLDGLVNMATSGAVSISTSSL